MRRKAAVAQHSEMTAKVLLIFALALNVVDAFTPLYASRRMNIAGSERMAMAGEDEVRLMESLASISSHGDLTHLFCFELLRKTSAL